MIFMTVVDRTPKLIYSRAKVVNPTNALVVQISPHEYSNIHEYHILYYFIQFVGHASRAFQNRRIVTIVTVILGE